MTRIPIESFRASGGLSTPLGRTSPMPFVAFAAILIIVAYVSPFEYAWNQSLNEDTDDVRPGIAAKEGSLQASRTGYVGFDWIICPDHFERQAFASQRPNRLDLCCLPVLVRSKLHLDRRFCNLLEARHWALV